MTEHRPRILLTGANGQVGWELRRTLAPLGDVVALTRAELDLSDADAVRACVRTVQPAAVVNPAAYTAVDRAEEERELAFAINSEAPRVLAEEAARLGAMLVHFSTDYVFDGAKASPYDEQDATAPLNVYGESKRAGELAIQEVGGAFLILRTSWVYGLRGHNFLRTMLRLSHEREELRVVNDQRGAPTWSRMLAEATSQILSRGRSDTGFDLPADGRGVFHVSAAGETTWHGFAKAILELDPRRAEQRCQSLLAVPTAEYPTPASRPRNSLLDSSRLDCVHQLRLPDWRRQLELALGWESGPPS